MKKLTLSALLSAASLAAVPAAAQQLELPAPSPSARVMQRVGLTDITVEYSSPAVKGRKVFGELVPFDKVWRTGANAATKVTFSRDVTVGDKPVPAGTYALVTLPTAAGWTVILSRELGWFAGGKHYEEKDDVARVAATTSQIPARERMTFVFSNTTDNATSLDLEWDTLRVSVPITVATAEQVAAGIKGLADTGWRPFNSAARYLVEQSKDAKDPNLDAALKLVDNSISIQSTWANQWTRADILSRKGKWADARKAAQASLDLGNKDSNFYMKDTVQKALVDWKNKK